MLLAEGPARSDPGEFEYAFGYFVPWKDALVQSVGRTGPVTCFDAASAPRLMLRIPAVVRAIREARADVVHCHLPLASVAGRIAGALSGIPVVSTEHNVLERYHPATRMATRATWRLQAHVIAVSGEVETSIRRSVGSAVPVTVIRNGVAVERFLPAEDRAGARVALGLPADAPVVGTIAVFRTQKRLDLWLEAARRIAALRPDVRFLLVGDGPLRPEVERTLDALGLRDRVTLPGLVEDVRPFLRAMDVYLVSSDFEGLPVALLEAMATGVVPVSTAVGGIPEVVSEATGFVVPRGDALALSQAVLAALGAPAEERGERSRRARERITSELGVEPMMRRTEAVYRQVLGR